jgi:NADPH-dependent curcumin reductase CurA
MVVTQILKLKGCKVVGIAGGKEKIDFAKSLGCDDTIDYKSEGNYYLFYCDSLP